MNDFVQKAQKVGSAVTSNPHLAADAGATIPTALVWLEQAPNVAALMTVLWFVYRFIREACKVYIARKNKKKT